MSSKIIQDSAKEISNNLQQALIMRGQGKPGRITDDSNITIILFTI